VSFATTLPSSGMAIGPTALVIGGLVVLFPIVCCFLLCLLQHFCAPRGRHQQQPNRNGNRVTPTSPVGGSIFPVSTTSNSHSTISPPSESVNDGIILNARNLPPSYMKVNLEQEPPPSYESVVKFNVNDSFQLQSPKADDDMQINLKS